MFTRFFARLRDAKIPVSLREFLTFLEALNADLVLYDSEGFYYLARSALVKDERHIDRFDRVFAEAFGGLEQLSVSNILDAIDIPKEWVRKLAERHLSAQEREKVEGLGGFDKLMEALKKRLSEQKGRHEGGSKWVGTGGTSPFGAHGYNPEGVRIGQEESRHQRAVKVWDKRAFRNLDGDVELGTRNIKVALKRLRRFAREGAQEELDLDNTIRSTAQNGYLDVQMRPERRNKVRVLLFLDVGGSMDPYVKLVEELFSAARSEFKQLEYFYFHNCPYEGVWRDNNRRWSEQISTQDLLNRFGPDYKVIVVGDASMSPYEILFPGGANEFHNKEAGEVWLRRIRQNWAKSVWINPVPKMHWQHTQSIGIIQQLFDNAMYPMTLLGIEAAMKELGR